MSNHNIYVTGHKHPDSDSICSAIAFANLLNKTGSTAIACRQGPLNEETKFILRTFHLDNPLLMTDARARLADINLDTPTTIRYDETVHHAWHLMLRTQNRSLYVLDENENLCGICSTSDLSRYRIHEDTDLKDLMATATLDNIARTIGGKVVLRPNEFSTNGQVHIVTLDDLKLVESFIAGSIIIMSEGHEKQLNLIRLGVKCLVLTCDEHASDDVKELAKEYGCAIVETPDRTMHTATVITESYSVSQIMTTNLICFKNTEYVEDVATKMNASRVRSYPVLDENGKVVGGVSRYHTRNYKKLRIALVDHSATNQTMNHIDKADIVAIIDHHHIGDIQTDHPIEYRNHRCGCTSTIIYGLYCEKNIVPDPTMDHPIEYRNHRCGCTSTIVYGLYCEKNIVPDPTMAGLMMSAILSDTLNFKSATTTLEDINVAKKLAELAGIDDIDAYAREMLGASVALKDSTPHEILNRDLKNYDIGKYKISIGQTNYSHTEEVQKLLPAFKENMKKEQKDRHLDLLLMLFTDVMGNGSYFVFYGPMSYVITEMIETQIDEHSGYDPNIISRKQQLLPKLSAIIKEL